MTREQAKELLPIMQAFAEGKQIEVKVGNSNWKETDEVYGGHNNDYAYRIKQEPKYRPFDNNKECLQEMLKHQPFGWVKEDVDYCNIIHIGRYGVNLNIGIGNDYRNYKKAFNLKFIDGTPFGIKEEN